VGTSVTPSSVFTSNLVLTNWFGKSAVLVIEEGAQLDRSRRGVDLVVDGEQLARCYLGGLRAIPRLDGQRMHLRIRACTCPRLSSAMVKITVVGCTCVMTTSTVPARLHHVSWVHQAKTCRPAIGAVMWQ
jgi:hypothetical protein